MKEKSLKVYGLNVPKVVDVIPTNLPALELNELRIDNIFKLEDGSYAIIDYESEYRHRNKLKYLGYVLRTLRKFEKEKIDFRKIKIRNVHITSKMPLSEDSGTRFIFIQVYLWLKSLCKHRR